jgi:hypothetical protein
MYDPKQISTKIHMVPHLKRDYQYQSGPQPTVGTSDQEVPPYIEHITLIFDSMVMCK